MNFIQVIRTGIIDEFECYSTDALMHSFIDSHTVNCLELFAEYMMPLTSSNEERIHLIGAICVFIF